MKRYMSVLIIFLCLNAAAQSLSTTGSLGLMDDKAEIGFLYEVKLVDEFIDRFNDNPAFVRKQYQQKFNKPMVINRSRMIFSLFNMSNYALMADSVMWNAFIKQAERQGVQLSMKDTNWYAEAMAVFTKSDKSTVTIPLIFQVRRSGIDEVQWIIAGISKFTCDDGASPGVVVDNSAWDKSKYIPLSSSSTSFGELSDIFSERMQPKYYFTENFMNNTVGQCFINSIKKGSLDFRYVSEIKYHFFQLKDWEFTVEHFERGTLNSGWLLNSLVRASNPDWHMSPPFLNRDVRLGSSSPTPPQPEAQLISTITKADATAINAKIEESLKQLAKLLSSSLDGKFNIATPESKTGISNVFTNNARIEDYVYPVVDVSRHTSKTATQYLNDLHHNLIPDRDIVGLFGKQRSEIMQENGRLFVQVLYDEKFKAKISMKGAEESFPNASRLATIVITRSGTGWITQLSEISFSNDLKVRENSKSVNITD